MRLRACIGGALLGATACTHLPDQVRIEVDGRTVEIRPRGLSGAQLEGDWSTSAHCGGAAAQTLEVIAANGAMLRLYRCAR